ncbi:family 24 glycoside hydrolase [Cryphonectria parasitica EP155]|uniref:Family 24 glycoside hydrolase n=1 Tax=Cryphonectria parasitica (strain ATCC 38755 / EP155) TaxID=660469 RepID=A0A9P4YBP9_CRYP1|nr:family 24 glycoside hydrolase [Cryphonectria parasitica EP155]KAF3770111.1 family 24 glycoside hydrolase [Cryphonectria parasitica EP155]
MHRASLSLLFPFLLSLLNSPIRAATTTCTISTGHDGICVSTTSCASGGGTSTPGFCPGAADIQCCTYGSCALPSSGLAGLCLPTSSCSSGGGTSTAGLCPGDSSIQCCTYGTCSVGGVGGECVDTGACSGTSTPGYCPSGSNIQCCTGGGGGGGGGGSTGGGGDDDDDVPAEYQGDGSTCSSGYPLLNTASLALIREFEGLYASPYGDPDGHPTIGIGHLCSDASCSDVNYPIPLSVDDAWALLIGDLLEYRKCISDDLASTVHLNANQFGALVSWAYNEGCAAAGSSTLIRELNAGEDADTVAEEELPKWVYGDNGVLPGLVRRRNAEVALFKTADSVVANPNPC